MTYTFTLIGSNGQELDVSNDYKFRVLEADAWGASPVVHYTTQGPNQHGVSWQTYRLQPRTVSLVMDIVSRNLVKQMERRDEILNFVTNCANSMKFRVSWKEVAFRRGSATLYTTHSRQIDCYYNGGLTFPSSGTKGFSQIDVIDLLCPDPIWYDPNRVSRPIYGLVVNNENTFPMGIPSVIGRTDFGYVMPIDYYGTWDEYPVLEVTGPVTDLVITNLVNSDKLDFTGHTIAAGKVYTIDLRYGHKTVTEAGGTNEIDHLTSDSGIATWRLHQRKPGRKFRKNSISMNGTSTTGATKIKIYYYTRYIGI